MQRFIGYKNQRKIQTLRGLDQDISDPIRKRVLINYEQGTDVDFGALVVFCLPMTPARVRLPFSAKVT